MATILRFEDLEIWKEGVKIGVEIYKVTSRDKLERDFSSKDQLRRAAISISNNIAEGFEYNNNKMFCKASAGELRSNLFVLKEAQLVNEIDNNGLQERLINASKNISGFMKYLKNFESAKNARPKRVSRA